MFLFLFEFMTYNLISIKSSEFSEGSMKISEEEFRV